MSSNKDAYTQEEWGKIERLVAERGKSYKDREGGPQAPEVPVRYEFKPSFDRSIKALLKNY